MIWLIASALAYEPIPEAVVVAVSAGGLDRVAGALADVMPSGFAIGAISGEFSCDEADPSANLAFAIDALDIGIHIDDLGIIPSEGRLDIAMYGSIDSTATTLAASGSCPPLTDLTEACGVELSTTPIEAHFGLGLALTNGVVDATVDEITVTLGAITNPVSDCTVSSAIGTLLGQNPLALTALLQSQIDPSLADLGPTIETSVEEALAGLIIETSLALGEGEIGLSIKPTEIDIDEDGLELVLGATISPTVQSACVPTMEAPSGIDTPPILDGVGPGDLDYDIAALVSKPFVDQLLFAVYQQGALCVDAGALGGIALDTSLFAPVFGDAWSQLFPESKPVGLLVAPVGPPTVRFEEDGAPIRLDLNGLGLAAYAALDARETRVFSIGMMGEVGLNLTYTGGSLVPALVLDAEALDMQELDHELLPKGYVDGLKTLLPTLLGSVLPDDLLPTFALPNWRGIGVENIWFLPAQGGDWLGVWVTLDVDDVQPIESPGCEGGTLGCDGESSFEEIDIESLLGCSGEEGGCDAGLGCDSESGCGGASSGCGDSGCATVPVRPVMFALAMLGALARRRRN